MRRFLRAAILSILLLPAILLLADARESKSFLARMPLGTVSGITVNDGSSYIPGTQHCEINYVLANLRTLTCQTSPIIVKGITITAGSFPERSDANPTGAIVAGYSAYLSLDELPALIRDLDSLIGATSPVKYETQHRLVYPALVIEAYVQSPGLIRYAVTTGPLRKDIDNAELKALKGICESALKTLTAR